MPIEGFSFVVVIIAGLYLLALSAAFVFHAPRMSFSTVFSLFGWVLLSSTTCLLIVPWRWHYRFAQKAVPNVTNHIALLGLAASFSGAGEI
ncbi:MAG: hypothetical protein ACI9UQ_000713 [Candidatus Krumholzibacteriia bacterium]|jgi:hypothetical protein